MKIHFDVDGRPKCNSWALRRDAELTKDLEDVTCGSCLWLCRGQFKDPGNLDPECVGLVRALNLLPGVRTFESCCGHGESRFRVWLRTNRVRPVDPLLGVLPHTEAAGWSCEVSVSGDGKRSDYLIESQSIGADAYLQAEQIADAMLDAIKESDHD